jgi:ADP-ribose pyrophosphatase YjhB (NUDIX family)
MTVRALLRRPVRFSVSAFQLARRGIWFVTRPVTFGVDAIALTPEGKVIIVKLTYASGWHLPGGRRNWHEEPAAAIQRELREEIGMYGFGSIERIGQFSQRKHFRHDTVTVFLLRDVRYSPRWSLEIEEVREFEVDRLPPAAKHARRWVHEAKRRGLLN